MGNNSFQPVNADDIESSQPTGMSVGIYARALNSNSDILQVPETPTANRRNTKKSIPSPESNSASPEVPATNGSEKDLNSDTSQPAKRKRDSEPERKPKSKKKSKSSQIEDEVTEAPSATPDAMDTEIPPTPTQPTPSRSARSKARQARKIKKNGTAPSTPSAKPAPEQEVPEQEVANHSSAPATPNPEGLLTPGGRPKGIRGSRTREKDSRKIGFFTPAEIRKIETFKIDFCTVHGLSGSTFDEMVQHSDRNKSECGDFPVDVSIISKSDFWNEIYDLIPERDRRSVYRFMRRHFQVSTQKAHDWTEEQDDELVDLIDKHGPKYTFIGKQLGRSDDDVTQRWKNKLEHRGTMNQGPWSVEESKVFFEAMQSTWANMKPTFGEKAPKDVYELDDGSVHWGNVSKAMDHKRSRQQCADKWRKIVRQVKTLRANGIPDAEFDIEASAKKSSRRIIRSNSSKSAKFVTEDDEDDVNGQANGVSNQSDAPEATKSPQSETQIEPTPEAELLEPPSTSKKSKKSKSKRKHMDDHAQPENGTQSDADDEPELPSLPQQTEAERRKERKDAKRQKKAEKGSKQAENEDSDGSNAEHSGDERSKSNSRSPNPPKESINEETDEDESESDGNSDVMDIKNEYDSEEL